MKRLKLWLALLMVIIIITFMVIWTKNVSVNRWIMIMLWAVVIVLLQLMLIYLVVTKNRHK